MKNSTSSSLLTGSTYHSSTGEQSFFFGGGGGGGAINKFYLSEYRGKVQTFLVPGVYHTLSRPVPAKNSGPKTGSLK